MKKQLLTIEVGLAGFWSAVSTICQRIEMLAIYLITGKKSKMSDFLVSINNDPGQHESGSFPDQIYNNRIHEDQNPLSEEIYPPLTSNWIDEDTSQGGEFLDDGLRIKDQPLRTFH